MQEDRFDGRRRAALGLTRFVPACALCGTTEDVVVSSGKEGTNCYICRPCEWKGTVKRLGTVTDASELVDIFALGSGS